MMKMVMMPLRGTNEDKETIFDVFYHLLKDNKNTFLPKEIQMCRKAGAA